MKQLVLTYPDDLAQAVQLTPEELAVQVRLMAALKMFELGKLSSGKAAELAGLSRAEFLEASGDTASPSSTIRPRTSRPNYESTLRPLEGALRKPHPIPIGQAVHGRSSRRGGPCTEHLSWVWPVEDFCDWRLGYG
jgi:hypothetical protein